MSKERTIVYVPSLDEAVDRQNIPIDDPLNGQDWGLVAEGYAYIRIEFVYAGETVTIARTAYQRLLDEFTAEKFEINNATRQVLDMGSDAILDVKNGEIPLSGIENSLTSAVATVFAMQANEGIRDWPAVPERTGEEGEVSPITVVEPIYPDVDANTSRWVSYKLNWDPEREIFLSEEADPDWQVDERAADDANYVVDGVDCKSIDSAVQKAIEDTEWETESPKVMIEPDQDASPEWGTVV